MDLLELKAAFGQEAWQALASALGTSVAYISQIAHGHRRASPALARRMVIADKRLTLAKLRPDIYAPVEPEQPEEVSPQLPLIDGDPSECRAAA